MAAHSTTETIKASTKRRAGDLPVYRLWKRLYIPSRTTDLLKNRAVDCCPGRAGKPNHQPTLLWFTDPAVIELQVSNRRIIMLRLNEEQVTGKVDFIHEYLHAQNAADGSKMDANANVTQKNIATLEAELMKDFLCRLTVSKSAIKSVSFW